MEVPTATNSGDNSSSCRLLGAHTPFESAKLSSLYPAHGDYVAAVRSVTMRNVKEGFILERDAEEIILDAEQSRVGTQDPLPTP